MPIAFLLGAPRSGTTLFRVMLAGHPDLFVPPEMILAPFTTMVDRKARLTERFWEKGGLRRAIMEVDGVDVDTAKATEASMDGWTVPEVYQWLQDRLGTRMLVDKCPHLSADPVSLARLARWYPEARWLWIVRHPGSVTRSIENMPMAEVILQGYAPDARSIWHFANRHIGEFFAGLPADRKAMVRYEDLVTDAKPAMDRVCAALGVPFDARLLTPYEGDRMREGPPGARAVGDPNLAGRGRIQPELATAWLEGFDPASVSPETHALARDLGYDLGTLPAPPITRVSAAMGALWDAARKIEAEMIVPNDLDALEGRRFLARMLSASTDLFVEQGDAANPRFDHAEGPSRKMFADNPDADYWRAPISLKDGWEYRVWGRVPPGTTYIGMLYYGRGGRVGNRQPDTAFVQPDGTFDVTLSLTRGFVGEADTTAVMVRQYFHDRAVEAPIELHVERNFGPPEASGPTAEGLVRSFERARRNLEVVMQRTAETSKMASVAALNRFIAIGGEQLFPTPDNTYLGCWFRLGDDQRMYIRGTLPRARYFSFCLYNRWMESLDYQRHRIHLNQRQIVNEGGRYEICLAPRDPGHPNWLDTTGHSSGYVLARALLAEGDIPVPTVEVRYDREGWVGPVP